MSMSLLPSLLSVRQSHRHFSGDTCLCLFEHTGGSLSRRARFRRSNLTLHPRVHNFVTPSLLTVLFLMILELTLRLTDNSPLCLTSLHLYRISVTKSTLEKAVNSYGW